MGLINGAFLLVPQNIANLPYWGWLGAILDFLNSGIGNAAWTMVIFTLMLKLITFPLDFFSRYKMKKNSVIMEDMKPQLEKLEKQCKGDKQLYNQRMMPLLKKEGYSLGGACLPTLLTLVLFIFIFQGLNSYATFRNADTYNQLVTEYSTMVNEEGLDPDQDKETIDQNLITKYNQLNPSWYWIKNPWRPDVNYTDGFLKIAAGVNPIASYDEFTHSNKKSNYGVGAITIETDGDYNAAKDDYDTIMGAISDDKGTGNGFYILIVLAVAVSFLSQFIMQKTQNANPQAAAGGMGAGTMKFMLILFPLMLGFFAFSYSSVFTLYIITNSTISLFSTLVINYVVEIKIKKMKERKLAEIKYRR